MTEDYADPELPPGEPPVVDLSTPAVAEVVSMAERILAAARSGDLVAIAFATAHRDGATGRGTPGTISRSWCQRSTAANTASTAT